MPSTLRGDLQGPRGQTAAPLSAQAPRGRVACLAWHLEAELRPGDVDKVWTHVPLLRQSGNILTRVASGVQSGLEDVGPRERTLKGIPSILRPLIAFVVDIRSLAVAT